MNKQLKPCPFCGKPPESPKQDGGSDERIGYNFEMRISCCCGVTISRPSHKGAGGWCNDVGQAESAVVEAWNSRV